jgi:hypothetical protein
MSMRDFAQRFSDLSTGPEGDETYDALYDLWNELSIRLDSGRDFNEAEFQEWDAKVQPLLTGTELGRFQKPLRPHIPLSKDTIQHARHLHLMKILRARQGWEKFMDDTGN